MEKLRNNSNLKYILVLCLGIALVLSRANQLHMHIQHEDHSSVASGHVVNIHSATLLHDINLTDHQNNHHVAEFDVNAGNLTKKAGSLNPLVVILFCIALFLCLPRLVKLPRLITYQTLFTPCYYLLHPPLRAPPVK